MRRISETNANFIGVVRLRGIGAANDPALDDAYRTWSIMSSSIGSELSAYVRDDAVQTRWRNYRTNMAHVYYFFQAKQQRLRKTWLQQIAAYWGPENPKGAFDVLDGLLKPEPSRKKPDPVYEDSLRELLDRLEQRSDQIVSRILEAPTTI